jgi:hypothetical protein
MASAVVVQQPTYGGQHVIMQHALKHTFPLPVTYQFRNRRMKLMKLRTSGCHSNELANVKRPNKVM